jgi:hypothetical protein
MRPKSLLTFGLGALRTCSYITAAQAYMVGAGTQFILYNGTISGSYLQTAGSPEKCGDNGAYHFEGLDNADLRIGVNAPWDPNPIYFEIQHRGNSWRRSDERKWNNYCPTISCTYDAIYNLHLSTAWYECFRQRPCEENRGLYLRLDETSISRVSNESIAEGESGPFYAVKGDEDDWDVTYPIFLFDYQMPRNYSVEPGCAERKSILWYVLQSKPPSSSSPCRW